MKERIQELFKALREDWNRDKKAGGKYFLTYCVVLIYLELVLRAQMSGGVNGMFLFFLCFVPAQALLLTVISGFFRGKGNIIVSTVLLALLEVYYIAQLIYYKNFGSLFSATMVGMGADAMGNFGWTLGGVIRQNMGGILLLALPVFVVEGTSLFYAPLAQEKVGCRIRLAALLLVVPVWFLGVAVTRLDGTGRQSAHSVYYDSLSDTDSTAAHLGALTTTILESVPGQSGGSAEGPELGEMDDISQLGDLTDLEEPEETPELRHEELLEPQPEEIIEAPAAKEPPRPQVLAEIDLQALAESATDAKTKELCLYLDSRGPSYTNDYTGIFEGYNLIYICAESFWTYAIDEQVTPTLWKMANQGVILTNYYNSFKNTTTNGEYAFTTGLWPNVSRRVDSGSSMGSFPQSSANFMPMGLGNLFQGIGATAYAYHNYLGSCYRRNLSWPNLGYTCKFSQSGMKFTTVWPSSDLEMMEQSVDDYIEDEQFHAYYMTFSGHGPYSEENGMCARNIDFVKENMATGLRSDVYNYMAANREFDKAMEYLLQRLEEAGKLDNTVIVITGDHYPYNLSDAGAKQLAGDALDTDFGIYKSTCIIYNAGLEENIVSDTCCCTVDILPTILNLFGIDFDSRLLLGRDVFSGSIHKAAFYNGSLVTPLVKYNSKTGKAIWSERAANYTDTQKSDYLKRMNELRESEYYASNQILSLNFYKYVWYNSGLMTDEELAAEEARAKTVKAKL